MGHISDKGKYLTIFKKKKKPHNSIAKIMLPLKQKKNINILHRRHINAQQISEKLFNITYSSANTNQNYKEFITSALLEWQWSKRSKSVVTRLRILGTAVGMFSSMGSRMQFHHKVKHRTPIRSSHPISRYILRTQKKRHLHSYIHCSLINNSQK